MQFLHQVSFIIWEKQVNEILVDFEIRWNVLLQLWLYFISIMLLIYYIIDILYFQQISMYFIWLSLVWWIKYKRFLLFFFTQFMRTLFWLTLTLCLVTFITLTISVPMCICVTYKWLKIEQLALLTNATLIIK